MFKYINDLKKNYFAMGYDSRFDNFNSLIYLISTIPQYNPNEPDLSI